MEYRQLKTFLNNRSDYDFQYQKRFEGFGVFVTELYPYLLKRGKTQKSETPLFAVPLNEIQLITQEIIENSNIIKAISRKLPGVANNQFYKEQLYKAIISSNEIEGVKTERKEVSEAYDSVVKKDKKNVRLKSTLALYNDIMHSEKIDIHTLEDIRDIYNQLTEGEIGGEEVPNGQLFREQVENEIVTVGNHIPPQTELEISSLLLKWIEFINDHSFPYLVRATLGHYFFENIHPFNDGNGRTGRYIFSRYLSKKLDPYSGLVISQKINENKSDYYKSFEITGDAYNKGEATFFMQTMLEYIVSGQKEIIDTLTEKTHNLDTVWHWLEENSYQEEEGYVLFLLYQSQLFTDSKDDGIQDLAIFDMAKTSNYTVRAVQRAIEKLESEGVIEVSTKRPKRHRIVSPVV
ncbi:Fic family protein [Lactococcus petauri]|uniref:Fic family protein n=1 Tax=Lactococcus TaxID=1357 RepID=UPI0024349D06|nr:MULTISPECIES: Fic family protein [Lactococcus]MDG6136485.1 Fic family protein [Lactococcus petauri]MDT2726999.1 Fic family protein [Lactococcus formosensis]